MKRLAVKFALAALLATFAIPALAQDDKKVEKDKTEKEVKEKKEVEQIIITRNSDSKEKTVVEINGDKITVNGKPIEDLKDGDVKVHRSKYKTFDGLNGYSMQRARVGGGQNFNWDNDGFNLFSDVDENRAMLGVVTEEVDGGGVKVTDITDESAAKKAGIKEGDVITKINDTKIESPDQLSEVIRKQKPGDKVTVTLLRDKKEQKLTTELGKWKGVGVFNYAPGQFKMDMPDYRELITPKIQGVPRTSWSMSGQPKLGLSVQDTDDGKGVKVLEVDHDSNAAKAGLKENDIITQFNDKEVNSADEVAKLVRENKDKVSIKLKVNRNGKTENIEVKMPRKLKTADL
jgi:serine protease Do